MFDCKSILSPQHKANNKSGKTITSMHEDEEWKSRLRDIAKQNKSFRRMIWEHMRALLLLLRTSRFDLDFIRGWKMMETAWFSPTSRLSSDMHPWRVCHTQNKCVLLSFSVMKKCDVSKCDSRTMAYLFCILDLYLPCCTPFFTAKSHVCVYTFSACLSFYLFSLHTYFWRDDQIKK